MTTTKKEVWLCFMYKGSIPKYLKLPWGYRFLDAVSCISKWRSVLSNPNEYHAEKNRRIRHKYMISPNGPRGCCALVPFGQCGTAGKHWLVPAPASSQYKTDKDDIIMLNQNETIAAAETFCPSNAPYALAFILGQKKEDDEALENVCREWRLQFTPLQDGISMPESFVAKAFSGTSSSSSADEEVLLGPRTISVLDYASLFPKMTTLTTARYLTQHVVAPHPVHIRFGMLDEDQTPAGSGWEPFIHFVDSDSMMMFSLGENPSKISKTREQVAVGNSLTFIEGLQNIFRDKLAPTTTSLSLVPDPLPVAPISNSPEKVKLCIIRRGKTVYLEFDAHQVVIDEKKYIQNWWDAMNPGMLSSPDLLEDMVSQYLMPTGDVFAAVPYAPEDSLMKLTVAHRTNPDVKLSCTEIATMAISLASAVKPPNAPYGHAFLVVSDSLYEDELYRIYTEWRASFPNPPVVEPAVANVAPKPAEVPSEVFNIPNRELNTKEIRTLLAATHSLITMKYQQYSAKYLEKRQNVVKKLSELHASIHDINSLLDSTFPCKLKLEIFSEYYRLAIREPKTLCGMTAAILRDLGFEICLSEIAGDFDDSYRYYDFIITSPLYLDENNQ
jgi:hypothetical protein